MKEKQQDRIPSLLYLKKILGILMLFCLHEFHAQMYVSDDTIFHLENDTHLHDKDQSAEAIIYIASATVINKSEAVNQFKVVELPKINHKQPVKQLAKKTLSPKSIVPVEGKQIIKDTPSEIQEPTILFTHLPESTWFFSKSKSHFAVVVPSHTSSKSAIVNTILYRINDFCAAAKEHQTIYFIPIFYGGASIIHKSRPPPPTIPKSRSEC